MTETPDHTPSTASGRRPPMPLLVAACLVAVEALLLVLQGILELLALDDARVVMGATTAMFFLLYGPALGYCAWALTQLKSWARAPVVVAQLIQLLVAWSFVGGATTPVAIALGVFGVLVLVGLFHPASVEALADEPADAPPGEGP